MTWMKNPAKKRGRKPAKKKETVTRKKPVSKSRARVRVGKRKPRPRAERISVQKYKEMYEAYVEKQTANYLVTNCKVCHETATKYIEEGDPDRGLIPIAERFRRMQQEAARVEDLSLAKANRETSTLVKASKAAWGKRLELILQNKENIGSLNPNQIVRNLKMIKELENDLLVDIEAKEKPRAPKLTFEESRAAAMAVMAYRREQAALKREAEQGGVVPGESPTDPPKLAKKRRLRPPPKKN